MIRIGFTLALMGVVSLASAEYPDRTTRIVSPFSPGGGLDVVARLISPRLSEAYRQPVIVENRTGADGRIANEFVATSKPDGYTLLIDTLGFTVHPAVVKDLRYDAAAMVPVAQLLSLPFVVVVNPNIAAKTVDELVSLARSQPGKLNFAQGGMTNRILGEEFRLRNNVQFTFVPYKGSNPATLAVLSGESDLTITDIATVAQHVASGKLHALALTGTTRSPLMPSVPTLQEAGMSSSLTVWYGVFAPPGTPSPVVKRLNEEIGKIVATSEITTRFAGLGATAVATTPEAFAALVRSQMTTVKEVTSRANISVE